MRFMLYNIRYGTGIGPGFHRPVPGMGYLRRTEKHLNTMVQWFTEQDPDIIGLVEVDMGSYRTQGKRNQAEIIAESMGYDHIYECKYHGGSMNRRIPLFRNQGNALITRHNIEGRQFHFFAHGVKRLIIELQMENLRVFLVHLSLGYGARKQQLDFLSYLVSNSDRPVLVAGDFNTFFGPREYRDFLAKTGMVSANPNNLPTHPSKRPHRQLDFIFHDKRIQPKNLEIPRVTYSDHLPIIFDFEINSES